MSQAKPVVVKCQLFWANLNKVGDLSEKYGCDIAQLSDGAVNALEMMGLTIKNKGDDKGNFVSVSSRHPIRAFDAATHDEIDGGLVGNGTQATVALSYYDWTFKKKEGRSASIQKMLITDLVEYNAGGATDDLDMEEAL